MTYQGKYKVKNTEKYQGDSSNVIYRSMWEKHAFKWCDENVNVKNWSSEEIVIPYIYDVDQRYHRYFIDLKIVFENNSTLLVEIKPAKELSPPISARRTKRYITEGLTYVKNQNKWEAAKRFAENKGWNFQIWTEKELEVLGILPKSLKKLTPYRKKS